MFARFLAKAHGGGASGGRDRAKGEVPRPSGARGDHAGHLSGIDALRGVAVLGVLLFHAFPERFPLGYLGVDAFFVVSGYVIARAYLHQIADRATSWKEFWARRFRRLAPAFAVCVLLTTIPAFLLLEPHLLEKYGRSLLAQPLYLQNFLFWLEGDYFEQGVTKPLLHTWSLAVEEQFYLFFFVPVLVARWVRSRLALLSVLALSMLAAFAMTALIGALSPKTAFYLMPFRAWQFLAGILAFLVAEAILSADEKDGAAARPASGAAARVGAIGTLAPRALARAAPLLATFLLLLLAALLLRPSSTEEATLPYVLAVTLVTAVLPLLHEVAARRGAPPRSFGPLVGTGRISYSLYLWHWPLISLLTIALARAPSAAEALGCLLLSFVLAILSYRYVERPTIRLPSERWQLWLCPGLAGFAAGASLGLWLVLSNGALHRYPEPERTWLRISQDRSPYRCPNLWSARHPDREFCPVNALEEGPGVLILGDSHADQLDEMLGVVGDKLGLRMFLARRNCDFDNYLVESGCARDALDTLFEDMRRSDIDHVLAVSSWLEARGGDFARIMEEFAANGIEVTFSKTTPIDAYFSPRRRAMLALTEEASLETFDRHRLDRQRAELDSALALLERRFPASVETIDTASLICPGSGPCDWLDERALPLYFDDGHLSLHGVRRVESLYRRALARIARAARATSTASVSEQP